MKNKLRAPAIAAGVMVLSMMLAACGGGDSDDNPPPPSPPPTTELKDWPQITSAIAKDAALEAQIQTIVSGLSTAQKVGQMTQPDIRAITPEQVKQYYIGSVLNGGGAWPGNNKKATPADWLALADQYWQASMDTDLPVKIPVIWGTDAVHGHSNVYGSTNFPHNIGLGAANDPALIERIGEAVAAQVVATGIDWTFAPTLAVVRDDRWGRTYEGFSEDPALVSSYGGRYVTGLQGKFAASGRPTVVATAKHFMGDGGTDQGKDQGETKASLSDMINIHGAGYYTAIGAGAQSVMASFNSWTWKGNAPDGTPLDFTNAKMHGNKYLMTDVLKGKMGFDGLIVTDWDGIGQVKYTDAAGVTRSCTNASCPPAINAGIDLVMVPNDWKAFITNTMASVETGEIPIERINDAVTRILRVKLRSGLFKLEGNTTISTKPSLRAGAADPNAMLHRDLAREAVRKSLVLLKNDGGVLPLKRGEKILVVGRSADSLMVQHGGWSLSWQGSDNVNSDFPNADSVLTGIKEAAGEGNVTYSATAAGVNFTDYKAVIAVLGESPYAEGAGDIGKAGTLEHAKRYPADLAVLKAVSGKNLPVITVLMTGRPVWINKELNLSDALVNAWLPGSEGKGVADVLFRKADGSIAYDFSGRLSYSWPKSACQTSLNKGDANYDPLFAYGYGLSYAGTAPALGKALDETAPVLGCGQTANTGPAASDDLDVFTAVEGTQFKLYYGSAANWTLPVGTDLNAKLVTSDGFLSVETAQLNVQQDAKHLIWAGGQSEFKAMSLKADDLSVKIPIDLSSYTHPDAKAALTFDIAVEKAPAGLVKLRIDCGYPCRGELDLTTVLRNLPLNTKTTLKVPLSCFESAGADFTAIDTPFLVQTDKPFIATFANIRWQVQAATGADVLSCDQLAPPPPVDIEPLAGPTATLFGSDGSFLAGYSLGHWSDNGAHVVVDTATTPGVIGLNFLADGGNGTTSIAGGDAINLSNFAAGTLNFELQILSWGVNTQGLAVKMESPGTDCRNVDYAIADRPAADGQFHPVSLKLSDVTAVKFAECFTLNNISVPFGIFPVWGDQQGVQFLVRNIQFKQ